MILMKIVFFCVIHWNCIEMFPPVLSHTGCELISHHYICSNFKIFHRARQVIKIKKLFFLSFKFLESSSRYSRLYSDGLQMLWPWARSFPSTCHKETIEKLICLMKPIFSGEKNANIVCSLFTPCQVAANKMSLSSLVVSPDEWDTHQGVFSVMYQWCHPFLAFCENSFCRNLKTDNVNI